VLTDLKLEKSRRLLSRAKELIPGGTNSAVRTLITRGLFEGIPIDLPAFVDRAKGSHVFDADGNEFIDYVMGLGPIIIGHANETLNGAVKEQIDRGTVFGANSELEIKLSEKIVKHAPPAEQVIICNTGSEATAIAIRLARSLTGRHKIVRFEGHYHGWHDWAMTGSSNSFLGVGARSFRPAILTSDGVPKSVLDDTIVLPWNDPEFLERTIIQHKDQIGAVITELYQVNWGVIPPEKGYLELMRRLTKENNIVLIFDEVITGFRMGLGGAQTFLGVKPDITTFAKAMANGFPIAAVAAMKQFMEPVASERTWVAGTFSGNPVSASAALATISELESKGDTKIRERGREVMKGISEGLSKSDLPAVVQGPGQMWSVIFTDLERVVFTREIAAIPMHPHIRRLVVFFQEMVRRGIIFQPSRYGRMYFSSAHDESDVEKTIQFAHEALKEAKKIG
jgi:glutamate-1-semialdehyde 2,1-aminomutase